MKLGNSMRTRISDNCYCSIHESAKKTFGPEDMIWYRINKEINNALWRSVDDAVYWTIEDSKFFNFDANGFLFMEITKDGDIHEIDMQENRTDQG